MSSTPQPLPLYYDEQVARIRKAQYESDKLYEESRKLIAEERKLRAEADKFHRERSLAPFVILTRFLSGAISGTVVALVTHFLH